jgi:hypothetical protein
MLQLTRELVDRDFDRIVEERLQTKYSKQKQSEPEHDIVSNSAALKK